MAYGNEGGDNIMPYHMVVADILRLIINEVLKKDQSSKETAKESLKLLFLYADSQIPDWVERRGKYCVHVFEGENVRPKFKYLTYDPKTFGNNMDIKELMVATGEKCAMAGLVPVQQFESSGLKSAMRRSGVI